MRVLLDENLPRKLKYLIDADVVTVTEAGWSGIRNGRLLDLAAREYDVFITMDKGIEFQQNVIAFDLCVLVLRAKSNDLDFLTPLVPAIGEALRIASPGKIVRVPA